MIKIIREEWYRCNRNPDDKDFDSQEVYTFNDMGGHIDFHPKSEKDTLEILLEALRAKTEGNSWVEYQIFEDDKLLFTLKDGKKWVTNNNKGILEEVVEIVKKADEIVKATEEDSLGDVVDDMFGNMGKPFNMDKEGGK